MRPACVRLLAAHFASFFLVCRGGVDMDPIGFNAIDDDGAGVRDGFMDVDVEWC